MNILYASAFSNLLLLNTPFDDQKSYTAPAQYLKTFENYVFVLVSNQFKKKKHKNALKETVVNLHFIF